MFLRGVQEDRLVHRDPDGQPRPQRQQLEKRGEFLISSTIWLKYSIGKQPKRIRKQQWPKTKVGATINAARIRPLLLLERRETNTRT